MIKCIKMEIRYIYEANGYYAKECYDDNRNKHVYVDEDLYYYNKLA
jgi:hypothetical protein